MNLLCSVPRKIRLVISGDEDFVFVRQSLEERVHVRNLSVVIGCVIDLSLKAISSEITRVYENVTIGDEPTFVVLVMTCMRV